MEFENKKNIVLIGMPTCGKTTIGKRLNELYENKFKDTDHLIINKYKKSLKEICNKGKKEFKKIEEEIILNLELNNNKQNVISTGGSVIYNINSMNKLNEMNCNIVYLKLDYCEISKRLIDPISRGVLIEPNETLEDLYNKRIILYEKFANIIIDCNNLNIDDICNKVISI